MHDAFASAAWFVVNVSAALLAARALRLVFPHDSRAQIAMHVLVALWACIAAVSALLGALGFLSCAALGMGVLLALLGANAALWKGRFRTDAGPALLATGGVAGRVGACPHERAPRWSIVTGVRALASPVTLWATVAALGCALLTERLYAFPKHWDDLMYHLPLVDHWLQDGRLYAPGCAEWYNPGNAELLGFWWAAPFSGDFWVGITNLPVVVLLCVAVLELGREIRLPQLVCHATAVSVAATEVVLIQLVDLENDVAVAALFAAGLAYATRFARSGRAPERWLAAVSLGLLAGVKYYALGYAAVAWAATLALLAFCRGRRAALQLGGAGLLAALALSAHWYFRNAIVTGTPFYPLGFTPATDVLKSARPRAFATTFLGNGRLDLWQQYFSAVRQVAGPCQSAAALLIPSAALWLLASAALGVGESATGPSRGLRTMLAFLLAAGILVFAVTPFTVDDDDEERINAGYTVVRYSQCPLLVALLALGVGVSDVCTWLEWSLPRPGRQIVPISPALGCLGAAMAQLATQAHRSISPVAIVQLDVGTVLISLICACAPALACRRAAVARIAWVFTIALFIALSTWLSERWHRLYADVYDLQFRANVFSMLESGKEATSGIAVADYRYYPFFGSRRQFRAQRPFRILSLRSLKSYVALGRLDVVAVIRSDPFGNARYRGVNDWVAEDTATFERIDRAASFDVYRVKSRATPGTAGAPNGSAGDTPDPVHQ